MKRIDENHSFNINVAQALNHVQKAILLKEIYNWSSYNSDNPKMVKHGLVWVFKTAKGFAEKFPYMNAKSISRWLDELCEIGMLYKSKNNWNNKAYDRTNWYTMNFNAYDEAVISSKISLPQNEEWISQIEELISQNEEPIHTPINTPNKNIIIKENLAFSFEPSLASYEALEAKEQLLAYLDTDEGIEDARNQLQMMHSKKEASPSKLKEFVTSYTQKKWAQKYKSHIPTFKKLFKDFLAWYNRNRELNEELNWDEVEQRMIHHFKAKTHEYDSKRWKGMIERGEKLHHYQQKKYTDLWEVCQRIAKSWNCRMITNDELAQIYLLFSSQLYEVLELSECIKEMKNYENKYKRMTIFEAFTEQYKISKSIKQRQA